MMQASAVAFASAETYKCKILVILRPAGTAIPTTVVIVAEEKNEQKLLI